MTPRPTALRYHGGKARLAPWIIQHFPPHRIYTEAFGGAANVLLQKRRSFAEVYNDLDKEVVNVFRILRDPESALRLRESLELTPYARLEFESAFGPSADPVETARRTIVKSFMGFGSSSIFDGKSHGMRTWYDEHRRGKTQHLPAPAQAPTPLPLDLTGQSYEHLLEPATRERLKRREAP